MDVAELLGLEQQLRDIEYVLHLCKRTRGGSAVDNVHPFKVSKGLYLMPTGTLRIKPRVPASRIPRISRTTCSARCARGLIAIELALDRPHLISTAQSRGAAGMQLPYAGCPVSIKQKESRLDPKHRKLQSASLAVVNSAWPAQPTPFAVGGGRAYSHA
jgi:hypothetical protein